MKKYGVKGIMGFVFSGMGLVFMMLCITTDINNDLFLALALACASIGLGFSYLLQLDERKKTNPKKN